MGDAVEEHRGAEARAEGEHQLEAFAGDHGEPVHVGVVRDAGRLAEPALELGRERETGPRLDELARQRRSRRPFLVERLGAVSTRPARTNPGKPTETRSQGGSSCVSLSSARMSTRGGHGYGVLVRTRSTILRPSASRTDALRPVPPMSIASVVGRRRRFQFRHHLRFDAFSHRHAASVPNQLSVRRCRCSRSRSSG